MAGYWKTITKRAWTDTKKSFGLNQKTVAISLIAILGAISGVIITFFHEGSLAAIVSATGLASTALPIVIVGVSFFAWNFFSVPPAVDKERQERISELERAVAKSDESPDYVVWRRVRELSLWDAAFLWCDLAPSAAAPVPPRVEARLKLLIEEVKSGELGFSPRYSGDPASPDSAIQRAEWIHQRLNADSVTRVQRHSLQDFAKKNHEDPIFLRDV
jgi:hypothetical protein